MRQIYVANRIKLLHGLSSRGAEPQGLSYVVLTQDIGHPFQPFNLVFLNELSPCEVLQVAVGAGLVANVPDQNLLLLTKGFCKGVDVTYKGIAKLEQPTAVR